MKKIFNHLIVLLGLGLTLSACHKSELVSVSKQLVSTANAITSENLSGTVKGTLLAGKTYYFSSDITINDGDTLLLQPGVHLIAKGDGKSAATAPEIFCHGTFISLGTKENPNYITVQNADQLHTEAAQGNYDNVFFGWWGGLTCTPTNSTKAGGDCILKWTHMEFGGGPAGGNDDPAIYPSGPRFTMYFNNPTKNLIIEDSWFFGSKDDNIQVGAAHLSVMRNTFELCGAVGGEFFNIKTGSIGDIAYNMFIGSCTNAMKISNSGNGPVQCNARVYNNTMVDGGFRQTKSGRGGSIDVEKGAKAWVYNNLVVNCRFGLRVTTDADITNTLYGYNGFYGYNDAIVAQFYCADGSPTVNNAKAATDVRSTTAQANNPMFYGFDVNKYAFPATAPVLTYSAQTPNSVLAGTSSFRLQAGSPFAAKGKTDFDALNTTTATGNLAATITAPGRDLGAYQSDGTGNQHN